MLEKTIQQGFKFSHNLLQANKLFTECGVLVDNKRKITYKRLTKDDIPNILDLQKNVLQNLRKTGHEDYIYKRTKDDFLKIFNNKDNGEIIGISSDDKLAGFIIINTSYNKDNFPYELPDSMTNLCSFDKIATFEGLMVDPKIIGMGFGKKLVKKAKEIVKQQYCCDFVFSVIDPSNFSSIFNFCDNNFLIAHTYRDKIDDLHNYLLCLDIKKYFDLKKHPCITKSEGDYHDFYRTRIFNDNEFFLKLCKASNGICFESYEAVEKK